MINTKASRVHRCDHLGEGREGWVSDGTVVRGCAEFEMQADRDRKGKIKWPLSFSSGGWGGWGGGSSSRCNGSNECSGGPKCPVPTQTYSLFYTSKRKTVNIQYHESILITWRGNTCRIFLCAVHVFLLYSSLSFFLGEWAVSIICVCMDACVDCWSIYCRFTVECALKTWRACFLK